MNPLTQSKNTTILPVFIAVTLTCFALSPTARAICLDACWPNFNTFQGENALISLTSGSSNTATGYHALFANTIGIENTANGASALVSNVTGSYNTAVGRRALHYNDSGSFNTATGVQALAGCTIGNQNVAVGYQSLMNNWNGANNTALGSQALFHSAFNSANTATGADCLYNNIGNNNTAYGESALYKNTSGESNVALGINALPNNTYGSNNIALGPSAGYYLTTGNNNIAIANDGVTGESATIRLGTTGTQTNTYIAGISGATVAGGIGVIVDSSGHLGTITSSARYKENIQPMDKASEAILSLEPVTFRYKKDLDPKAIPQFGFVAEQVEKVNPDLVAHDEQGKPYTVRYEAVNAMLLNEFLKEHREVQEQKATIVEFKKEIANLTATVKQQSAQIQKVSAQLEARKSAPQVVLNNQ